ncbi:MAG TPA: permease-like cell division protein FtsX [Symbiobacteriaceae bacterium]
MSFRAWALAVRDSVRSIVRSPVMSLASMATVAVSLLVLAVILLLAVNLEYIATTVEQQVEIAAYLCASDDENPACENREPTEAEKRALVEAVKRIPGVEQVTFVSKDVALQRMKEQLGDRKDILEEYEEEGKNPLRDALEIRVVDPNEVKRVAAQVEKLRGVSEVNYGKEFVDRLLAFTRAVRLGGIGLVMMLLAATVLTLSNTIRLSVYARRREIAIMKLVGATDWYIRRPFIVEGVLLGVVGGLLAMALTGWGYVELVTYVQRNIPFLPMVAPQKILGNLTGGMILLGALLGSTGSIVSMRRFLKV